ncbi:hypothetical protein JET97_31780 [Pseudomonas aeruginosa]|nr:hypothetical protein [Pseudomonas aeruginosa]MBG7590644.1 hypothetical protein [Pseudomonas aeruginosa]MBI7010041.1 hypothetical protein [Pseudomonas aeruginosa]MBI7193503.1 hypothetical protein [Pseudomonas aeruginosa]
MAGLVGWLTGRVLKFQGQHTLNTLKDQLIPYDPSQPIQQLGRQLDDGFTTIVSGVLADHSPTVEVTHGHVLVT